MTCIYYGDIASMEGLPYLLFSALHKGAIIDARCVARPAPKTTDSEEHRMERKANNLGCGASLGYGEERND